MTPARYPAWVTAAVVLAVVLAARGSTTEVTAVPASPTVGSATSAPVPALSRVLRVSYTSGQVGGDSGRVEIPLGDAVDLVVTSDVADAIHLHGYDRSATVSAGGTATLTFLADIPGVFEVELEERGQRLLQLAVQ